MKKTGRYFENGVEKFGTPGADSDTAPDAEPPAATVPTETPETPEKRPESKYFPATAERKAGKEQPLAAVLQIATGRMICNDYEDIFDTLSYMCHMRIDSKSYPEAMEAARKELFKQYPELKPYERMELPADIEEVEIWFKEEIKKFGEKPRVDKLADDDANELHEVIKQKLKLLEPKKKKNVRRPGAVGTSMSMSI